MTPTEIASRSAKEYEALTSDLPCPEVDTTRTFRSINHYPNDKGLKGLIVFTPTIIPIHPRVYFSHRSLLYPSDRPVQHLMTRGMGVAESYNWAVSEAINTSAEYLLTLEHDNCPEEDGLLRLLATMRHCPEYAAIGGLYHQKGGIAHIWGDPSIGEFNTRPLKPKGGYNLIECCATALGFTLFRLDMFRDTNLRRPWFRPAPTHIDGPYQEMYFWEDAYKHVYKCAVDCAVRVGHYDFYDDRMW